MKTEQPERSPNIIRQIITGAIAQEFKAETVESMQTAGKAAVEIMEIIASLTDTELAEIKHSGRTLRPAIEILSSKATFIREYELKDRGTVMEYKLGKKVTNADLSRSFLGITICYSGYERKVIGVERMGSDDRLTDVVSLLVK